MSGNVDVHPSCPSWRSSPPKLWLHHTSPRSYKSCICQLSQRNVTERLSTLSGLQCVQMLLTLTTREFFPWWTSLNLLRLHPLKYLKTGWICFFSTIISVSNPLSFYVWSCVSSTVAASNIKASTVLLNAKPRKQRVNADGTTKKRKFHEVADCKAPMIDTQTYEPPVKMLKLQRKITSGLSLP
jgi:hypothetical protein